MVYYGKQLLMNMFVIRFSKLFLITCLLMTGVIHNSLPASAQEPSAITLVSDTQTEWDNNDTWEPATLANQHPAWPSLPGANWIWNHQIATPDQQTLGDTVTFRRVVTIPEGMTAQGTITVMADNLATVLFNDTEIGTACFSTNSECFRQFPLTANPGENTLTFIVTNTADPLARDNPFRNPAGFIYKATLTLEEAEKTPDPIVLVPGMLASFNHSLMLGETSEEDNNWIFILPARTAYQALIDRLELAGYKRGENLFIAHYDWRQTNTESATEYLVPTIEEAKAVTGSENVDVIAHSMGGLVTRAYVQGENYENDIDQFIMLGTPNEGATDAYLAWEGGILPGRWDQSLKWYLNLIETAHLKRNGESLPPPLSFRKFFPFLKDLLPIYDFAARDNELILTTQLSEQNLFLQQLQNITGINVTTIAGSDLSTLQNVLLAAERSPEDELRQRWRDGHPNPDPPQPNTTEGDETVLLASAQLGSNTVTIPNVRHINLPEEAQQEVLTALDLDATGDHIHYTLPKTILSVLGLSPIDIVITGPNGEVLSKNNNTFAGAEYTSEAGNPQGSKLLIITDPPPGEYQIRIKGTGEGEYSVITTFADADEVRSSTRQGSTEPGKDEVTSLTITTDGILLPAEDVLTLAKELKDTLHELKQGKQIQEKAFGQLNSSASQLHGHTHAYATHVEKHGQQSKQAQQMWDKMEKAANELDKKLSTYIGTAQVTNNGSLKLLELDERLKEVGLIN